MEEEEEEIEEEEEDQPGSLDSDDSEEEEEDMSQQIDFSQTDPKTLRKLYPNLPAYYFLQRKERKKFFKNLNKAYRKKVEGEKNIKPVGHSRKVRIVEKKNQYQRFKKAEPITKIKKVGNLIGKRTAILKRM